jgi:hypothetical protein
MRNAGNTQRTPKRAGAAMEPAVLAQIERWLAEARSSERA